MLGRLNTQLIPGPAGQIEIVIDEPAAAPRGVVVVAHPHPLMGGTMNNKVVHTICRAFVLAGWRAVRFNFRGIGQSEGAWDEGRGEIEDMLAVIAAQRNEPAMANTPLALAGFSFGGYVASQAHARLTQAASEAQAAPQHLVLVSPATSRFDVAPVPATTLVVEGEQDDVVPLSAILDWARPQSLPVTVVPGTGHFFHGQLPVLREIILKHLRAAGA